MIEHVVNLIFEAVWERKPGFLTAVVLTLITVAALVLYFEVLRTR